VHDLCTGEIKENLATASVSIVVRCQRRQTFREGTNSVDRPEISEAALCQGLSSRNERLWNW
jgi:hypothetical protein